MGAKALLLVCISLLICVVITSDLVAARELSENPSAQKSAATEKTDKVDGSNVEKTDNLEESKYPYGGYHGGYGGYHGGHGGYRGGRPPVDEAADATTNKVEEPEYYGGGYGGGYRGGYGGGYHGGYGGYRGGYGGYRGGRPPVNEAAVETTSKLQEEPDYYGGGYGGGYRGGYGGGYRGGYGGGYHGGYGGYRGGYGGYRGGRPPVNEAAVETTNKLQEEPDYYGGGYGGGYRGGYGGGYHGGYGGYRGGYGGYRGGRPPVDETPEP